MSAETWKPIPDFPEYWVSDYGRVYNTKTERLMAESRTLQGDSKVTLSSNGERVTRSVRVLVAEAFVPKPPSAPGFHKSAIPDTVIMLDNDQTNVTSYNLAWRPRWFAHKYARQFKQDIPGEYLNIPVMNLATRHRYSCIVEAAIKEGLLFNDVFKSATAGIEVYPTSNHYVFE